MFNHYYSCGLSTATIEYSSLSVCLSVCVHDNSKNNGSINLKLEHIVVALSDQGQGHSVTLKFFSIYHNTNCQGPYLSFGTR